MANEVTKVTTQFNNKVETIADLRNKISKYTPRNVNKREKRLKTSINMLTSQVDNFTEEKFESLRK